MIRALRQFLDGRSYNYLLYDRPSKIKSNLKRSEGSGASSARAAGQTDPGPR